MKKKAVMCLMAALCLGSGMTAYAAPETMPDGTIFDAEFYAQIYPDVVAVFGTDADAMYQHYVQYGKNEGRFAYAGAVQLPVNETDLTAQAEEQSKIIGIQGILGGTYQLPTWGDAEVPLLEMRPSLPYKHSWLSSYLPRYCLHFGGTRHGCQGG